MAQQQQQEKPVSTTPVQPWIIKPLKKSRVLSPNPPPYEHPRILFSAEDKEDLIARALGDNDASARAGLEPHSLEADIRAGELAFADLEKRVQSVVYGSYDEAPVRVLLEVLACGETAPGTPEPAQGAKEQTPAQVFDCLCDLVTDKQDPSRILRGSFFTWLFKLHLAPTGELQTLMGPMDGGGRLVREGEEDTTPALAAKLLFCSSEGGLPSTTSPVYSALKEAAYCAWIRGETERLAWLGRVLAMAARVQLLWYPVRGDKLERLNGGPPGYNKEDTSGCQHLALAYDLLHGSMSEEQRLGPRRLLLSMGRRRVMTGFDVDPFQQGRGPGLSHLFTAGTFQVMTSLWLLVQCAVEGESVQAECDAAGVEHPGLEHDLEAQQYNCEGLKFWLTYGTAWEPTGPTRECPGYFATAMRPASFPCLAAARRGYDMFGSTNFYSQLSEIIQTSVTWFKTPTCLGGHDGIGYCGGFGQSEYYIIAKYMFPNDPVTDYVYQVINIKWGGIKNYGLDKMPFQTALFGTNVCGEPIPLGEAAVAGGLPLANFANARGMGTAHSDWSDPNVALLYFECRPDMYRLGHGHSNRNDFYFASHNRIWISGGQYHNTAPEDHSSVLIDGVGQGGSHTSECPPEFARLWSHVPGKVLETLDSARMTGFVGDATVAYSYVSNAPVYVLDRPDPKNPVELPLTWRDFFLFPPDFGKSYFYDLKTKQTRWEDDTEWASCKVHVAGEFNPVEYALRTACIIRGPQPYVLIVDDIKKDGNPHRYTWVANTTLGFASWGFAKPISLLPSEDFGITDPASKAVLARGEDLDPSTGKVVPGRPLLLLSVLHAEGDAGSPIRLVSVQTGYPAKLDCASQFAYDRVEIERTGCVEPMFKVMLFPFLEGEPLPAASFDLESGLATVESKGHTDIIHFQKVGNRTHVRLVED